MDSGSLRYAGYVRALGLSEVHRDAMKLVGRDRDVLDVGCSAGYVGEALIAEAGCRVDGIEQDPAAAAVARQHYGQVHVGSLEDPAFLATIDGRYDAIVCIEVLEHVANPVQTLTGLRALLKPGGFIALTLPNIAHWSMRWHLLNGHWQYAESGFLDHTHLRFYTYHTAPQLVTAAGLDVAVHQGRAYPFERISARLLRLLHLNERWSEWVHATLGRVWPNLLAGHTIIKAVPRVGSLDHRR